VTKMPPQIGKLLAMLASDQDGEVLAAVAAIKRCLAGAKLDLNDLARAITGAAVPAAMPRPAPPPWRAPVREEEGDGDRGWRPATEMELMMLADLLREGLDGLRPRERDFLRSLEAQRLKYKSRFRLSAKQREWLESIYDREAGMDDDPEDEGWADASAPWA
jgi:hypothetical protein